MSGATFVLLAACKWQHFWTVRFPVLSLHPSDRAIYWGHFRLQGACGQWDWWLVCVWQRWCSEECGCCLIDIYLGRSVRHQDLKYMELRCIFVVQGMHSMVVALERFQAPKPNKTKLKHMNSGHIQKTKPWPSLRPRTPSCKESRGCTHNDNPNVWHRTVNKYSFNGDWTKRNSDYLYGHHQLSRGMRCIFISFAHIQM